MPSKNYNKGGKRIKRKYKGGQEPAPQQVVPQPVAPQQVAPQPVIQQPASVPTNQLQAFPKKIRLNVTSDLKSVIEAPEEAEYILASRLNSAAQYGNPDVYLAQFGNDEETGQPTDIYSSYVYERLKDLGKKECQILKHRGDEAIDTSGLFTSSQTSRRQVCAENVKAVKKDDNRILQAWIDAITKNGINFLENVTEKITKIQEEINDLEASKKDMVNDLKDETNTLNDNIKGINRETQQRLQEITRIIQDKEEKMSESIDAEIVDLQNYIKEETSIVQTIEDLESKIKVIDSQINDKQKELVKTQNGLNNVMNNLNQQGIDLEGLVKEIERSIQMNLMAGGRKKRKSKKPKKPKKSVKSKKKKSIKKRGRPKKQSSKKKKSVKKKRGRPRKQ